MPLTHDHTSSMAVSDHSPTPSPNSRLSAEGSGPLSVPALQNPQSVVEIGDASDITDIKLRFSVTKLMNFYPEAGIKTCYVSLVASNGIFEAASESLSFLFGASGSLSKSFNLTEDGTPDDPFGFARRPTSGIHCAQTAIDQGRAQFTAQAVLEKAFSKDGTTEQEDGFKRFGEKSNPFPYIKDACRLTTNDVVYSPAYSFEPGTEGTLALQNITSSHPYAEFSTEELRLGEYSRYFRKAPHRFTLFPKLPPEVRAMIWEAALPGPRVIELRYSRGPVERLWSVAKAPTILHVNFEARKVAKERYPLSFGTDDCLPTTRFNFERDTIFFCIEGDDYDEEPVRMRRADSFLNVGIERDLMHSADMARIRSVAIDRDLLRQLGYTIDTNGATNLRTISAFKNLENLTIVDSKVTGGWKEPSIWCDWTCECYKTKGGPCGRDICCERCRTTLYVKDRNDQAVFLEEFEPAKEEIQADAERWLKVTKEHDAAFTIPTIAFMTKSATKEFLHKGVNKIDADDYGWKKFREPMPEVPSYFR
ncbi:hypothetical protein PVAG01_02545 [Phlyctema vagabunda]|uniref:2EXR domain-containing protein n=1 Tax=Phlyctema vagabunda TaxID=108571 RepID=A0ABR4PR55_9HELO